MKRFLLILGILLCATVARAQGYQENNTAQSGAGLPLAGASVAVCSPATIASAAVTNNLATLVMSSNPVTAGFIVGGTLTVAGFTGADTYFNGNFTILAVSTSTITYPLTHANAAGASVGTAVQRGTSGPCASLAALYSDTTLGTPISNPTLTDGLGNYAFGIAPGPYWLQIYGPNVATTFRQVTYPCVTTGGCGSGGGGSGTGYPNLGPNPITAITNAAYGSQPCDGVTINTVQMNNAINGLLITGGTPFIPDNCTGAITFTSPTEGIALSFGGRFNPTSTMHVPGGYALQCHEPFQHSNGFIPFLNTTNCPINTSLSTVLSLENASGFDGLVSGLSFYGPGTQLAVNKSGNTIFRDIWSQVNNDAGIPFKGVNGFGYYFERGGFLANSPWPTGAPSMNFITTDISPGCDPPRIILWDRTFLDQKGVNFDSHLCAHGGDSTFIHSQLQLYEGGSDCMFCLDITGGGYGAWDLYEPITADNAGGLPTPVVQLTGIPGVHTFYSSLIVNPGPVGPIYRQPPGTNQEGPHLFDGAIEIGCIASYCPLGIYGYSNSFFNINKHGGLTTFANTPSAAFAGGMKIPIGPPSLFLTPSSSGGTLPAGLVCYMVVVRDSLGKDGFPSGDICTTLTGSTSSVSMTLSYTVTGAASYLIYRHIGGPIEDDLASPVTTVAFISSLPGTPFVDTGGAGAGNFLPIQMEYDPATVAATDQLTESGGWLGVGGCIAIGRQGCAGGAPGDLQIAGHLTPSDILGPLNINVGGFQGIITHFNTANRAYTLQNANGTLAFTSDFTTPAMFIGQPANVYPVWNGTAMVVGVPGTVVNVQASSTYPIAPTDRSEVVKRTNTTAGTDTLGLIGGPGYDSSFYWTDMCWGTAKCAVSATAPNTFTVNGVPGLTSLQKNAGDTAYVSTESATGVANAIVVNGNMPQLFAALQTCSVPMAGRTAMVTDPATTTWGATMTGTGTPALPYALVLCDGQNWTVVGK